MPILGDLSRALIIGTLLGIGILSLPSISLSGPNVAPLEVVYNPAPFNINQTELILVPPPGPNLNFPPRPAIFVILTLRGTQTPAGCGTPEENLSPGCFYGHHWTPFQMGGTGLVTDPYRFAYQAHSLDSGPFQFFVLAIDGTNVWASPIQSVVFNRNYPGLKSHPPERDPDLWPDFWTRDYQVPAPYTNTSNAFWVSDSQGSDQNPGTQNRPVKTIKQGLHLLRNHLRGSQPTKHKLIIKEGVYHSRSISSAGCVTVEDYRNQMAALDIEGTPQREVYIMAEPGKEVILDGYSVGPATDGRLGGYGHSGCSGPPGGRWTIQQNSQSYGWQNYPLSDAALVDLQNAKHVTVQGFTLMGSAKRGIQLASAKNVTVQHNTIIDAANWAIHGVGQNQYVKILGNRIVGVYYGGRAEHAIYMGGLKVACRLNTPGCDPSSPNWHGHIAKGTVIVGNTIAYTSAHGIKVNGSNHGVVIAKNKVYRYAKTQREGASGIGITGSSGVLIRNNLVAEGHHDCISITHNYETQYFSTQMSWEDKSRFERTNNVSLHSYRISNNTCEARTEYFNAGCVGNLCPNNRNAIRVELASGGINIPAGSTGPPLGLSHLQRAFVYPPSAWQISNNRFENLDWQAKGLLFNQNNAIQFCEDPSSHYYLSPYYHCGSKTSRRRLSQPFRGIAMMEGIQVFNNLLIKSHAGISPVGTPLKTCYAPQSKNFCGETSSYGPHHPLAGLPQAKAWQIHELEQFLPAKWFHNLPHQGTLGDSGFKRDQPYQYQVHGLSHPNYPHETFMENFALINSALFSPLLIDSNYDVNRFATGLTNGKNCPRADILGRSRPTLGCTLGAYEYQVPR